MHDYDGYDEYDCGADDLGPDPEPTDECYDTARTNVLERLVARGEFAVLYHRLVAEGVLDDMTDYDNVDVFAEMIDSMQVWFPHPYNPRLKITLEDVVNDEADTLLEEDPETYDANYGDPCGCSDPHCSCSGSKVVNFRSWG